MIYWQIFLAFFIPGILGYGGGPSSIPLVENEVVHQYGWMTVEEFSEVLALGNALPGPIATKMAGYIGYEMGGVLGAVVGVTATVGPSLLLMVLLLNILYKYKDSKKVKRLTLFVRPVIALLLGIMAWRFLGESISSIGIIQTMIIGVLSLFFMEKIKINPAIVIVGAFIYGALLI